MGEAKHLLRLFVLCCVSAAAAFSQTAQLTGTVSDSSGAVVPDARVTASNLDTGVTRDSVTNDSGIYLITGMLPGNYRVTAEKSGFKQSKFDKVTLAVDEIGGINFALEIGAMQETVTVQGTAVLLDTATSTVASLVNNREVTELPLNGRSPMDLVALSPGIRVQGTFGGRLVMSGTPGGAWMDFSFNGGMAGGNSIMVEGLALEMAQMNAPSYIPPPDATQEFRVSTNPFSAEYNRTSGAVINFSIKSGTNQFHGTAYEFYQKPRPECERLLPEPGRQCASAFQSESVRWFVRRPYQERQDVLFWELRRVQTPHRCSDNHDCTDRLFRSRETSHKPIRAREQRCLLQTHSPPRSWPMAHTRELCSPGM